MFTRVTNYKMKPESIPEATEKLKGMIQQIMAMDGMLSFTNAVNEDGNGVVISLVESEEKSNANQDKVAQIWASFSEYLLEAPSATGFQVVVHENT